MRNMHQSAIALKPLAGEVNSTDYLITVARVMGWDILEQSALEVSVGSRKNGQA